MCIYIYIYNQRQTQNALHIMLQADVTTTRRRQQFQSAIQLVVASTILSNIPPGTTHISIIMIGQIIQDVDIGINNACQKWEEDRKQAQQKLLYQEKKESIRTELRSRLRAKTRQITTKSQQKQKQKNVPKQAFYGLNSRSLSQRHRRDQVLKHQHQRHNSQKRSLRH